MNATRRVLPSDLQGMEPQVSQRKSVAAEVSKLVVLVGALFGLLVLMFNWGQSIGAERIAVLQEQIAMLKEQNAFLAQQLSFAGEVASLTQQRDVLDSESRQLQSEIVELRSEADGSPPKPPVPSPGCEEDQIDINTAAEGQLQEIKYIGEARAPEVIRERPFDSVADLKRVTGIGQVYIEEIIEEGIACVTE